MENTAPYRIALPLFEGPLDLLLHLIKKNDLNIHDIPISTILTQYLDYLQLARELDIDLAGEFLDLAAELTYIKSKKLLPELPQEGEEEVDPRADLVAKLLEYQKYKWAAQNLLERPQLGREIFRREAPTLEPVEEQTLEVDTLTLLSVFQELLKRMPKEQHYEARNDRVGVAERIIELIELLRGKSQLLFEALFESVKTRSEVVTTFLALLEMARQRLARVVQEGSNGAIVVCPLFSEENTHESQKSD